MYCIGLNFSTWKQASICKKTLTDQLGSKCHIYDLMCSLNLDNLPLVYVDEEVDLDIYSPATKMLKYGDIVIKDSNDGYDSIGILIAKELATSLNCYTILYSIGGDDDIRIYSPLHKEFKCGTDFLGKWSVLTGARESINFNNIPAYKQKETFLLDPNRISEILNGSPVMQDDVPKDLVKVTDSVIQGFYGLFSFFRYDFSYPFKYEGTLVFTIKDLFDAYNIDSVNKDKGRALDIVKAFYTSNKWCKTILLATGDKTLIDVDYSKKKVENSYGELLMEVRKVLR